MSAVDPARDEFYIGYEDRVPSGIGRRVIAAVVIFGCAAAGAVAVTLAGQRPLPASRFEFGVVKPASGVLRRVPYPRLEVEGRYLWLAGPGKFGADDLLASVPDGPVQLRGTAIARGRHAMLEVRTAAAARPGGGAADPATPRNVSDEVTLRGEIVDSKCFLGVMNPGEGTVHRDCAARCLSGGMPPMLVVRSPTGEEELVVLASARGDAMGPALAPLAGQPVEVTGRLARDGDDYMLYADRSAYRLLR